MDFTSLYPTTNKYGDYPIKHPDVYLNPQDQDISHYYGVAKCRVRAPRGLYHPVLPVRVGEKLMFPLSVKCVEAELEKPLLDHSCACPHDDVQREFVGTWCTAELMVAKDKGYDILQIYEVYHFKEDQRKVGLFAPYVDKWYKIKMEASGWPESCQTEDQKNAFIAEFYQREKIQLSYEELEKGENKGLRSLAKLMLNSMWGKFGQRPNKTQVVRFTNPNEFHEFLDSDKYNIQKFQLYQDNEDVVDVFYTLKEDDMEINGKVNIFVAAFTTCLARLKLYSELDQAGEQVLYYDTESMILNIDQTDPSQYRPILGDFLGDFTNELYDKKTGVTHHIVEFASAGPKNYGYEQDTENTNAKSKDFP